MSIKMKLVSLISLFILVLGLVVIGVLAASQQTLTMTGSVNFNVADRSLWVKQVRIKQDNGTDPVPVTEFLPGYINGENGFNMNIGDFTGEDSNTLGSFSLYFDIINTTDIQWAISNVTLSSELQSQGVTTSYSGVISAGTLTSSDQITQDTELSGTLILTISAPNLSVGEAIDLSGITITIEEYIDAAVQVTSVSSSGATTDTYTDLAGGVAIDGSVDLSGITFNTGKTTLTISMTSLSAKYIKNIVSYDSGTVNYNTTGTSGTLFVHSTSLYLPQNSSGELSSGESKDLTIYVNNNTSSAKTISGLKVSFEEKESLLQKDTENKYWYIEMGTVMGQTQSEYIRWKYIASVDDSSGSDVATKYTTFDADTTPTGKGYFYLETNVLTAIGRDGTNNMIEVSFNNDWTRTSPSAGHQTKAEWTSINANDYATSNVRRYINGVESYDTYTNPSGTSTYPYTYEPTGRESNMYDDLNIDTANDLVYEKIATRSLGELYKDNSGGSSSATSPADVTYPSALKDGDEYYQSSHEDAFWLLSYYEVYNLVGSSNSDRVWPSDSDNSYWLRSPSSSVSTSAYLVYTSGYLFNNFVDNHNHAVRAAFKFSI